MFAHVLYCRMFFLLLHRRQEFVQLSEIQTMLHSCPPHSVIGQVCGGVTVGWICSFSRSHALLLFHNVVSKSEEWLSVNRIYVSPTFSKPAGFLLDSEVDCIVCFKHTPAQTLLDLTSLFLSGIHPLLSIWLLSKGLAAHLWQLCP